MRATRAPICDRQLGINGAIAGLELASGFELLNSGGRVLVEQINPRQRDVRARIAGPFGDRAFQSCSSFGKVGHVRRRNTRAQQRLTEQGQQQIMPMAAANAFARGADSFLNVAAEHCRFGRRDPGDVGIGCERLHAPEIFHGRCRIIHLRANDAALEQKAGGVRQLLQPRLQHAQAQIVECFIETGFRDQQIQLLVFGRGGSGVPESGERALGLVIADPGLRQQVVYLCGVLGVVGERTKNLDGRRELTRSDIAERQVELRRERLRDMAARGCQMRDGFLKSALPRERDTGFELGFGILRNR